MPRIPLNAQLGTFIAGHEDRLMERVLSYARERGYTRYTSTLQEAWRLSVSGLSAALLAAIEPDEVDLELSPDEDFTRDPAASFGIIEARRHRERGISLSMFLGLMKYYRQSYTDLIRESGFAPAKTRKFLILVDRFFDRVELGFCEEWASAAETGRIAELQSANRSMTNEKNKYLTTFESLPHPVILLDRDGRVDNLNQAAALLFKKASVPGAQYYSTTAKEDGSASGRLSGMRADTLFPWLSEDLGHFAGGRDGVRQFEKQVDLGVEIRHFNVLLSRMLDVSGKFSGTILILRDVGLRKQAEADREKLIVELRAALSEVKTLRGFLPICAHCKKIRDDTGYWQQIEQYVSERSQARFSHGICPECIRKLYPDYADD